MGRSMTITEMADELDLPEEVVAKLHQRARVYFNIHTIRLDKGISLDNLIKGSEVESEKVRAWDMAGQIIFNYMSDYGVNFDQAFVELLRDKERLSLKYKEVLSW